MSFYVTNCHIFLVKLCFGIFTNTASFMNSLWILKQVLVRVIKPALNNSLGLYIAPPPPHDNIFFSFYLVTVRFFLQGIYFINSGSFKTSLIVCQDFYNNTWQFFQHQRQLDHRCGAFLYHIALSSCRISCTPALFT